MHPVRQLRLGLEGTWSSQAGLSFGPHSGTCVKHFADPEKAMYPWAVHAPLANFPAWFLVTGNQ